MQGLTESPLTTSAVRLAVGDRLVTLFDKGARSVRAAVVDAVRAGAMPKEREAQKEALLTTALQDRSYQVRLAAGASR